MPGLLGLAGGGRSSRVACAGDLGELRAVIPGGEGPAEEAAPRPAAPEPPLPHAWGLRRAPASSPDEVLVVPSPPTPAPPAALGLQLAPPASELPKPSWLPSALQRAPSAGEHEGDASAAEGTHRDVSFALDQEEVGAQPPKGDAAAAVSFAFDQEEVAAESPEGGGAAPCGPSHEGVACGGAIDPAPAVRVLTASAKVTTNVEDDRIRRLFVQHVERVHAALETFSEQLGIPPPGSAVQPPGGPGMPPGGTAQPLQTKLQALQGRLSMPNANFSGLQLGAQPRQSFALPQDIQPRKSEVQIRKSTPAQRSVLAPKKVSEVSYESEEESLDEKAEERGPDHSQSTCQDGAVSRMFCESTVRPTVPFNRDDPDADNDYGQWVSAMQTEKSFRWTLENVSYPRRVAHAVCTHRRFEILVACVICVNALTIGVQADWSIRNIDAKRPLSFEILDVTFMCIFIVEWVLRVVDEGFRFLHCSNLNSRWNLFDTLVVLSGLAEEITNRWAEESQTPDVSAIRVLRMVRLVRVLRVVRVMRFFKELRTMVQGIMSSFRALFWCMLLLVMLIFIFAVIIMQISTEYLDANNMGEDAEVLKYFGTLAQTLYTLFLVITSGLNWGEPAALLISMNAGMGVLFALYIAFSVLCVLNIVTGVFVDNANQITKSDADNMIMEELTQRDNWIKDMEMVFQTADVSGRGALNMKEFVKYSQDLRVQAYFRKIGLNVEKGNATALFKLIDINGDQNISLEEFVEGCAQFVGNARQLDIARLRCETMCCRRDLHALANFMVDKMSGDAGIDFCAMPTDRSCQYPTLARPSGVPPLKMPPLGPRLTLEELMAARTLVDCKSRSRGATKSRITQSSSRSK